MLAASRGDKEMILELQQRGADLHVSGLTLIENTGSVFMKGLRLSQVLGLNPVLKLRLLSQLSFVLIPYSQRVT